MKAARPVRKSGNGETTRRNPGTAPHADSTWIDGGITAVSNLVLLCKRDHLDLHSGHWNIQIIDDVVHVTRPPWADPGHIPPNKYQPPHLPDQPPTTNDRNAQPTSKPSKPAGPGGPSAIDPWGDDPDTGSASHPAPALFIPWAGDPPPPGVAAPDIPWADDPLPVSRSAAPWSEVGFDPWGEVQETSRRNGPDAGSGSDELPPPADNALGSVA